MMTFRALFFLLFSGQVCAGVYSFLKEEQDFSDTVTKACGTQVKFNLHDYEYGTDEKVIYSNRHFQDCSAIKYSIAEACKKHPKNAEAMKKVKEIYCQRGGLDERKILLRNNGDLVFIIDSKPDRESMIEESLTKVLKMDFKADYNVEQREKSEKAAKEKDKAEEQSRVLKTEERNKKIADLTAWFQGEVKKITSAPGPDMSQKLEKLSKTYEEKLNAITSTP